MKFIERLAARNRDIRSERPVLIACLGDSVTHGCFELIVDDQDNFEPAYHIEWGYVHKLGAKLRQLFPAAVPAVLNAGISGDNSGGGLERLERDVLAFRPDLVTVNFGLNDSMSGDTGIPQYAANMRAIFEKILASGAEAMLVTPSFMCSYVPAMVEGDKLRSIAADAAKIQNTGVLARYAEAARAEAQRLGIPVADAYRRWEELKASGVDTTALLSNGINHPTAEMHDLFVEEIMRKAFEL